MNKSVHFEVIGEGQPILVLHGGYLDHRHMIDALEPIFDHREGWKRVYIDIPDKAGHSLSWEQPQLFFALADEWLQRVEEFGSNSISGGSFDY